MKKLFGSLVTAVLLLSLVITGCSSQGGDQAESQKIVVGATPVPHVEILKEVKPILEQQGITLEIKELTDYTIINKALAEGDLDANFFQHQPYLDDANQANGYDLVSVASVHIEPLGIYSNKIKNLADVKEGASVAIPNDATNGGRALNLLADAGLFTLKEGVGTAATKFDIVDNPKNIEVKELEAALLPRALDDVDLAVINGNYALDVGLNPAKDSLQLENGENNPYANILVVRTEDQDKEVVKKLSEVLTSPEVKAFLEENYQGSVIPAF